MWIPHKKIAYPSFFSFPSYLPFWSYGPLKIFEKNLVSRISQNSRQSEEPKNISVGIFEYILASVLKVFLNM